MHRKSSINIILKYKTYLVMKRWRYQFESDNGILELISGEEAFFDADLCRIFDVSNIKDKFIVNVSDHRVSKKAACSIKSYGDVEIRINNELKRKIFHHLKDGDTIKTQNKVFTIRLESGSKKRTYSSCFKERTLPKIDNSFPVGWSEPAHHLLYYRPKDCTRFRSNKAVLFDVDWTIIKTQSGKTFPQHENDWTMWNSKVIPKLNDLYEQGTRIIFVTNQNGIATGQTDKMSWKTKMEQLMEKIEFEVEIFVSSGPGKFRKPSPGIFYLLKEFLELRSGGNILMVGDAAGRLANKLKKKKKDFGPSDRTFAINCGIAFKTPEEYFLNEPEDKYEIPVKPQCNIPDKLPKLMKRMKEIDTILSSGLTIFICIGYPGSGKSQFGRTLVAAHPNVTICCRDELGSRHLTVAKQLLNANTNVYIDCTNPDIKSRSKYIELAMKSDVQNIIALVFCDVDIDLARHNCRYRSINGGPTISDVVLYTHRKKFEEPDRTEGFTKLLKIPFVPDFQSVFEERLYNMFLPSV